MPRAAAPSIASPAEGACDDRRETQAPGGYQLHPPDSPEAEALLAERGLTRPDLDHAIAELARTEGVAIRSIVGINDDGVIGSRQEDWRADLPGACAEPFIPLLWLQVLEQLDRVPKGSTAKFRETARCRTDRSHTPSLRRRGCSPGGGGLFPPRLTEHQRLGVAAVDEV